MNLQNSSFHIQKKNLSQYDLYMADDYSKIVEQVLAERQLTAEVEQQNGNSSRDYYIR